MTDRTLYVTTPIYYVNDVPHVGHAYTTIAADALTRARRLQGRDAFMLTGTDEHGQNIERIAREKGIPAQRHCDEISAVFRRLWERLDIRYDRFIRTTDVLHKRGVLKLWDRLVRAQTADGQDAVYRATYAGWYCPRCEAFKDEDELKQPGNVCPDHERTCEWTEEENFFFRLSAYAAWLRTEITSDRILIRPDVRRNEVLAVLDQGLKDFSVSRARVKWGIPVPEQPDHVLYVWVDALSNYVTALGYADDAPEYRKYWAGDGERMHLIGKEIIRFHCLYWPAMLHAAGLPVPNRFFAHGWLTKDAKKLSKTTGNVIDPDALVDRLGSDVVRYFFLREGSFGQDWDFTDAAFVGRYNADLANDLGNLVSRALTMVRNYCGGRVPRTNERSDPSPRGDAVFEKYETLDFSGALAEIWALVSQLNQRIVTFEPWVVAKDPSRRQELDSFLYTVLERVRQVAVFISPVMPRATSRIFRMLGLPEADPRPEDLAWGRLEPGTSLGTIEPLFPRVEKAAPAAASAQTKENTVSETPAPSPAPAPAAAGDKIDIADF
ncbi:MAG: methionine--tRNA ligase, partial [Acidobacteria bacterium]|nr:methionine--tRNA ligase [Acidobacteriota bacterium]